MARLFYVTLGNKAIVDTAGALQDGSGLTNWGDLPDLQPAAYWSGASPTGGSFRCFTWTFDFGQGFQINGSYNTNVNQLFASAVHAGDAAAPIPEPTTCTLMLAGLAALALTPHHRCH
jgi:hypothetical protein